MANTPEGLVKDKVRAILKAAGIYHFTPMSFGMARSGIPDIIACVNGRFLAIECKAGRGKVTTLQAAEIANIVRSGGVALVITEHDLDLLRSVIRTLHGMVPITIPTPQEPTHDHEVIEAPVARRRTTGT